MIIHQLQVLLVVVVAEQEAVSIEVVEVLAFMEKALLVDIVILQQMVVLVVAMVRHILQALQEAEDLQQ